jgi:HSP20 family protein
MNLETLKESAGSFWTNLTEGWRHLAQSAAGALTRFRAGEKTDMPAEADVDDPAYLLTRGWAVLGGDLFEDDKRLVVRLEAPGMEKDDLMVEVLGDTLVVSGEKRFEREDTQGRWRVMQCAYGSFRRTVPLPVPVLADRASARYRNGVLRVELPKAVQETRKPRNIQVQ